MQQKRPNTCLLVCILLCTCFTYSIYAQSKHKTGNGLRFNFGPAISYYDINYKHARSPFPKFGLLAGFKYEWRLDREHRAFFLTGIDYLQHGLNFQSYYFKPDTLKLYDKSFAYKYSLTIHELNLPLQLKYLFKRRDNRLFSAYFQLGYHFRYLVTSDLKITLNGKKVKYDSPELQFKNPLFINRLNSFLSLSYGLQKNSIGSSKGHFFVELNLRYGFSPYSFSKDYAPSSMYISNGSLLVILGVKL